MGINWNFLIAAFFFSDGLCLLAVPLRDNFLVLAGGRNGYDSFGRSCYGTHGICDMLHIA